MKNSTVSALPLDFSTAAFPFYYVPRENIFDFISDNNLSLLAPVLAYVSPSVSLVPCVGHGLLISVSRSGLV